MFLQVSLSSGDLIKKGNVFTTVFIFSRLDEQRKCFYNTLYLLETLLKKEMFLQLSLSFGDLMKKGNVFTSVFIVWRLDERGNVSTTVFIFCRLDEQRKCFYKCLYRLET